MCRVCEEKVADEDLEEHIASSHPRGNFAAQSKRKIGSPESLSAKKREVAAEVDEEVLELLEKLNLQDGSSCTKNIIDVHSASPSWSSSPARHVPPWLPEVVDEGELDWYPSAPVFGRDLLPDPLPVVMAVFLEMETQTMKRTEMDNRLQFGASSNLTPRALRLQLQL